MPSHLRCPQHAEFEAGSMAHDGEGCYSRDNQRVTIYHMFVNSGVWIWTRHSGDGLLCHTLSGASTWKTWDLGDDLLWGLYHLKTQRPFHTHVGCLGWAAWKRTTVGTWGLASSRPGALRIVTLLTSRLRAPDVKGQCTRQGLCHRLQQSLGRNTVLFSPPRIG